MVEEAIERLRRNPRAYAIIESNFRRVLVRRFPYAIYFRTKDDLIAVYGVFHNHQNTDVWQRRGD